MSDHSLFIVSSAVTLGAEHAGRRRIDDQLKEIVLNTPGCVAATHYELSKVQQRNAKESPWRYLTIYELDEASAGRSSVSVTSAILARASGEARLRDGDDSQVFTPISTPDRNVGWVGREAAAHIMVVRTNPVVGRAMEYAEWYETHIAEVLAHSHGYVGAERLRLADVPPVKARSAWEYVTIYDIADPDLAVVHASHLAAHPTYVPFAGIIREGHLAHAFTPLSGRVSRPNLPEAACRVAVPGSDNP